MNKRDCEVGLIGLGVMGRNFAMNMADHGFSVAGYDRDQEKARELESQRTESSAICAGADVREFVGLLRRPRSVILLVPAGNPVDAVIHELELLLEPGDLIIDSGNSHFSDTDRRSQTLSEKGLLFMGMGISGGESGARHGPSLMPGGRPEGYQRVQAVLEASAARVESDPCVAYLGSGSAGHYVKMVHNGIEYAVMQLIAESYDLMKRTLGLNSDELSGVYDRWNRAELESYLVEITSRIFMKKDGQSDKPLVELILDRAEQKGTGKWTSQDAMELQVPTPTIDSAVAMRDMSGYKEARKTAAQALQGPPYRFEGDREQLITRIENALYASMIIGYTQGMALLKEASEAYGYGLDPESIARIWRGGCIIRAGLLDHIRAAYKTRPDLPNLLLDPYLGGQVMARQADLRSVVCTGARLGLPLPGMMASLAYVDSYRSAWLPANLIQAQRDYFGSHTYERADSPGVFHTEWEEN